RRDLLQEHDLMGLETFRKIRQVFLRSVLSQVVQAGPEQMGHSHGFVSFALIPPSPVVLEVLNQILERVQMHALLPKIEQGHRRDDSRPDLHAAIESWNSRSRA